MKFPDELPNEGFVRLGPILKRIGCSKSTWYNGIREARFPAPVRIGPRISAWRVSDIRDLFAKLESNVK